MGFYNTGHMVQSNSRIFQAHNDGAARMVTPFLSAPFKKHEKILQFGWARTYDVPKQIFTEISLILPVQYGEYVACQTE